MWSRKEGRKSTRNALCTICLQKKTSRQVYVSSLRAAIYISSTYLYN